jgi:hypothetical protein
MGRCGRGRRRRYGRSALAPRYPHCRAERSSPSGEIDLFVAATVTWDLKPDDDRLWAPGFKLGAKVFEKAGMTGLRRPSYPGVGGDFQKYRSGAKPRFIRTEGVYSQPEKDADGKPLLAWSEAVQSTGVDNPKSLSGVVVSRGPVSAKAPINRALILATGDVVAGNDMNDSVVICDGDVRVAGHMNLCLVIARGKIAVGEATASDLYAGKTVTVAKPFSRVEGLEVLVSENEPKTFGFITFFELARIGLEVKVADGAVQVSKVVAGKASEKAGLKVGDVILEANGKKPADAESLRRLLRDALAVGDATVKVQRGKDTISVKLTLPE